MEWFGKIGNVQHLTAKTKGPSPLASASVQENSGRLHSPIGGDAERNVVHCKFADALSWESRALYRGVKLIKIDRRSNRHSIGLKLLFKLCKAFATDPPLMCV